MKLIKKIAVLVAPLLLFAVLLIPYSWANQQFIVEWFGCGCPVLDEFGNMVENNFNANDFTALFWLFVSICTTVISVLLSKRILKETMWLRVLYIVGMLVASLFVSYQFYQMMMWNWPIPICRIERKMWEFILSHLFCFRWFPVATFHIMPVYQVQRHFFFVLNRIMFRSYWCRSFPFSSQ